MAEDKPKEQKFYWLRLYRDFFKQHEIVIIEGMPNGKEYILFYFKLLCESVTHDGCLRFSEEIPYNEIMLASLTHTNIDIVRSAVQIFLQLHMMEILDDGTYYMNKVQELMGSETYWAKKKREERARIGHSLDNVQQISDKRYKSNNISFTNVQDILSESDDSSHDSSKKESVPYQQIVDKYNEVCGTILPKCSAVSDKRRKAMAACWKAYKEKVFDALQLASESEFLTGKDNKWTNCNFDWIFNTNNMLKILEGVYKNKKTNPNHYSADPMVGTPLSEEEFRKANSFLFEGKGE